MAPLGKNNCAASCGAARVPVGPVREIQNRGVVGTEAGGQGGKAAGLLTTATVANGSSELL